MAHTNTVLGQLLKLFPRHEFTELASSHHEGQKLRAVSRWSQFVALVSAQLTGRQSLRDVVENLSAQSTKLYHLGAVPISRSSLARVNERQPWTLYEALFHRLLKRCQQHAPGHGFRFKHRLFSLDSSTIDVCLAMFPWAKFRQTKGAIKLHVGLDHAGMLPTFVTLSEGKAHDVKIGRTLDFPANSMVVCDRGYNDYAWYKQLNNKGVFFVTRQRRSAKYRVVSSRKVLSSKGVISDETIELSSARGRRCPDHLRRIEFCDSETGKQYVFLTNHFGLAASTIAAVYKSRWQIELFFKWIKQNLKIKTFLGTSKNAVLTQIWVAMCAYLLLTYLKLGGRLNLSLQQILRLLQLSLFERRSLIELLDPSPPDKKATIAQGILEPA